MPARDCHPAVAHGRARRRPAGAVTDVTVKPRKVLQAGRLMVQGAKYLGLLPCSQLQVRTGIDPGQDSTGNNLLGSRQQGRNRCGVNRISPTRAGAAQDDELEGLQLREDVSVKGSS